MLTKRNRLLGRSGERLFLGAALVLAFTLSAATAEAQKSQCPPGDKACELYFEATKRYTLGEYEEAIKLYRAGYEESGDPAFLFNIAQSYRQLGDCKNALFFYRRFLLVNPNAPNRKEVEDRIQDLEDNCKQQEQIKQKPPVGATSPTPGGGDGGGSTGGGSTGGGSTGGGSTTPPGGGTTGPDVAVRGDDDDDDYFGDDTPSVRAGVATGEPELLVTQVQGGASFIGMGDLEVPARFSLTVGAGYPLPVGPVRLDLGAVVAYTPLPWSNESAGMAYEGTASLTSLLANVGANYEVIESLYVRGDLGLGALLFGGLSQGNLFTAGGRDTTGALSMFNLRVGLSADYLITPNLAVTASPAVFSWSPAKEGLEEHIDAITRFEMLLGVGYRM